jgi:hypothetical protein
MSHLRTLRLLRIAVSVVFTTLCLLLILLWGRSYYYRDVLGGEIWSHVFAIESADGHVAFKTYYLNPTFTGSPWGVTSHHRESSGFGVRINPRIVLQDWCVLVLFGALAASPWAHCIKWDATPRRFGVRDLLLATTLVAVVLGLVVAMR